VDGAGYVPELVRLRLLEEALERVEADAQDAHALRSPLGREFLSLQLGGGTQRLVGSDSAPCTPNRLGVDTVGFACLRVPFDLSESPGIDEGLDREDEANLSSPLGFLRHRSRPLLGVPRKPSRRSELRRPSSVHLQREGDLRAP